MSTIARPSPFLWKVTFYALEPKALVRHLLANSNMVPNTLIVLVLLVGLLLH